MRITQNFVIVNTLSSKLIPETENDNIPKFGNWTICSYILRI